MRFTASEKQEIIHIVDRSEIGVNKTLKEIGLNKSTFYNWYKAYSDFGIDGLAPNQRCSNRQWNTIPQEQKNLVIELALEFPHLSSRELAFKLTDEQVELANKWMEEKEKTFKQDHYGAVGGSFGFLFIPTSIGTIEIIKCFCDDDELDLTDYDSW